MRSLVFTAISISVSLHLFITPAFPLDPTEWDNLRSAQDARSYEQAWARYQEKLDDYDYSAVFRSLQAELEASPVWADRESRVYQNLIAAFRKHNEKFANFKSDLAGIKKEEAVDDFLGKYPTGLFQFKCPDERCFAGQPFQVTYAELEALPDGQTADFLYRIEAVAKITADFSKQPREMLVKNVRKAAKRWEIFIREGKSQYPWEAAFNGWVVGTPSIQFPPDQQWTLVHPLLGVELYTRSVRDLKVNESLAIELLGHTWYRWKNRNEPEAGLKWGGVSAVATLRDDVGPGVGIMAHYGRFFNLGVTWHDKDGRRFDSTPYVLMGVDLFRFAEYKAGYLKKKLDELPEFARETVR